MVISRLDIGYPIYPKGSDFHCFYSSLPELLNKEKRAGGNQLTVHMLRRTRDS